MGLFKTDWTATWNGHRIAVHRNEVTRGVRVTLDDAVVAEKVVTLTGLTELSGTATVDGKSVAVAVHTDFGSKCHISIDGTEIDVQRTG